MKLARILSAIALLPVLLAGGACQKLTNLTWGHTQLALKLYPETSADHEKGSVVMNDPAPRAVWRGSEQENGERLGHNGIIRRVSERGVEMELWVNYIPPHPGARPTTEHYHEIITFPFDQDVRFAPVPGVMLEARLAHVR